MLQFLTIEIQNTENMKYTIYRTIHIQAHHTHYHKLNYCRIINSNEYCEFGKDYHTNQENILKADFLNNWPVIVCNPLWLRTKGMH